MVTIVTVTVFFCATLSLHPSHCVTKNNSTHLESLSLSFVITIPNFLQLTFKETIDIAGALEIKAGFRIAELLEKTRGVNSIEGIGHRETSLVHQTGDEILHYLLLHVLEFCLRYVHFTLISLSIARWVQKAS